MVLHTFERGIPVVPALLDGAVLPTVGELPDDVRQLALSQFWPVRGTSFEADVDALNSVQVAGRAVALLVAIVVDVCYYFYGMAAYTGRSGDSGDLYRAVGFFVLLAVTGTLLRRLLRRY